MNWAKNAKDHKMTYVFVFSLRSKAISWDSKEQPISALSRTEAEYRGAALAASEVVWCKRLLKDLNESVNEPIPIYYDKPQ